MQFPLEQIRNAFHSTGILTYGYLIIDEQ